MSYDKLKCTWDTNECNLSFVSTFWIVNENDRYNEYAFVSQSTTYMTLQNHWKCPHQKVNAVPSCLSPADFRHVWPWDYPRHPWQTFSIIRRSDIFPNKNGSFIFKATNGVKWSGVNGDIYCVIKLRYLCTLLG